MKKLIFSALAAVSVAVIAETKPAAEAKKELTPEQAEAGKKKMAEAMYRATGGRIVNPKSGEGKVVFYNAQAKVTSGELAAITEELTRIFAVRFEVQDGKAAAVTGLDAAAKGTKGVLTIFLVEDGALPMSLVAYESGWGLVNAAKIEGADRIKLTERFKKELSRVFALTGGVAFGMGTAALMKPVRTPENLDDCYMPKDFGNGYITGPIHKYLMHLGLMPVTVATYARACKDGWAPAPTNDVQKAIWDKAKAKREMGPTNPIKILPKQK